jgi:integrase
MFGWFMTRRVVEMVRIKPPKQFYVKWNAALAIAGAVGFGTHAFRRTAATRRRMQGVPDKINNRLSGWKDGSRMFDRYSNLTPEEVKLFMRLTEPAQTVTSGFRKCQFFPSKVLRVN